MDEKIKWGVLSTATIAVEQMIPALFKSRYATVRAIASRKANRAEAVAKKFNIPTYYGSYQELLEDADIQAVYIPLPNHLHVEWAIKALNAGKHVLVEKPIGLSVMEARRLMEASKKHPGLKLMEGFMYRFHPQWTKAKQMVEAGEIGKLQMVQSSFSFYDDHPDSIVNSKAYGGGSLMDIGCYSISIARYLFGTEPKYVMANIKNHPVFEVDVLASGILKFDEGVSTFFCATQLAEDQQAHIYGTEGKISFEFPFNPPKDRSAKIWFTRKENTTQIAFDPCDQYTLQADAFAHAILGNTMVPTAINDGVNNMKVIEKLRESHEIGKWIGMNEPGQ